MKKKLSKLLLVLICIFNISCSLLTMPNDPEYAPVIPQPLPRVFNDTGSIYQNAQLGSGILLYENIKSHQVGDIITVILNEKTDSQKNAQNSYEKKTTDTFPEPTFFGSVMAKWRFPKQFPAPLTSAQNLGVGANISSDLKFEGTGTSLQNNALNGTISVTVAKIYSNGNLYVRGEKWVGINEGDEYIRLAGIIRPDDITPENTIPSSRIADARITYSGKGGFGNSNKPGWLTLILTSPWWPF